MKRQQTILDKLHDELLAGVNDRTKEEELWEVQRVVTTLKRKLRQMKKDDAVAAAAASVQEEQAVDAGEPGVAEEASAITEAEEGAKEEGITAEEEGETESSHKQKTDEGKTDETVEEDEVGDGGGREGSKTPTFEKIEEQPQSATPAPVASDDVASEAEPAEKDEDYVDMGHDEGYKALVEALLEEEQKLVLETEEMNQLGEELRRKIESEKSEIDRLKEEMDEIRLRRAQSLEDVEMRQKLQQQDADLTDQADSAATTHVVAHPASASAGSDLESNYSGGSGSESELDEEELHQLLQSLLTETNQLFREKQNFTVQIETERTKCMNYKIQIRLMQWRTERLMTLQQKQDEKLLRDKPLLPVAASMIQSLTAPSVNAVISAGADQQEEEEEEEEDLKSVERDLQAERANGGMETEERDEIVLGDAVVVSLDECDQDLDSDGRTSPIEVTQF